MAEAKKKSAKRGASKNSDVKSPLPGWLWLATGLAVGLFVAFLVFLQGQPQTSDSKPSEVPKKKAPEPEVVEQEKSDGFSYDFYKLLPNMEVFVPEGEKKSEKQGVAPVEAEGTYLIQAGSFKKFADADRRKAALALLGVRSRIVKVTIDDKHVWHRVHIGPFSKLNDLNEVRQALFEQNIDTLVIRIKG